MDTFQYNSQQFQSLSFDLAERRMTILRDMGSNVGKAKSTLEAYKLAASTLSQYSADIPIALIYLINYEKNQAHLAGITKNQTICDLNFQEQKIDLKNTSAIALSEVLKSGKSLEVTLHDCFPNLSKNNLAKIATTKNFLTTFMVIPIKSKNPHKPAAIFIAGVNPRITLDKFYRNFLELIGDQITAAANTAPGEEERIQQEVYDFFLQVPSPLVILLGSEHRFTLVNPAYEKFVGRKVLGKTVLEAFTLEEVGEFIKRLDGVYETGQPYLGHELPLTLPDENGILQNRVINVVYHPYRDSYGHIKGILAVHQDITEQKISEARLLKAKEEAEKASQLKSAFLANMSHEIRTPLGVIMGFTDLISDANTSDIDRTYFANILKRNGEQLSVIINDILDLSKVEAGELQVNPDTFNLRQVLEDIFSAFKSMALEKKIEFKVDFEKSSDNYFITTDIVRFKQILWNLIGNAIKFTEHGFILLLFKREGDCLLLEVQDTGIGISPEHQYKLFKPFSQIDQSNTRKYGGTGLGLTLSKKLANLLGGDLFLKQSSVGVGSIFQLSLKNTLSDLTHKMKINNELVEIDSDLTLADRSSLKNINILLVEDAPDNQKLISHILSQRGAKISLAVNGVEGVEKAFNETPDLVLMDIQMPLMDGYTATQILRRGGFSKPIIALTAHAMSEIKNKCLEVGYTDYLTKPINFLELIKKLRQHHYSTNSLVY